MKKIIALILVLTLSLFCFVACKKDNGDTNTPTGDETPGNNNDSNNNDGNTTPTAKNYSVVIATDSAFGKGGKVTNVGLVLVIGEDGKIVAARVDSAEPSAKLDENGALIAVDSVESKVEKGEGYTGMQAGSWETQAKAFEQFLVGKTAAEIAALQFVVDNADAGLVAGCTMKSTMPTFQALIAKAFANENKVTFSTTEDITVGIAIDSFVKSGRGGKVTATSDLAGVVMAGGKVVACVLDSVEQSYTITDGALVANDLAVSKNDQGEGYTGMPAGAWYKQAQAFANSAVGKTAAELANLETVSDALAAAGCTMKNTTAGYKATIISAAEYAR